MKTTDLQQPSRTVTKYFLATMSKHVRFIWKLSLGNVMGTRTMHIALVSHLCRTVQVIYMYLAPQWLIFSSS
jgi:hypothetical protein